MREQSDRNCNVHTLFFSFINRLKMTTFYKGNKVVKLYCEKNDICLSEHKNQSRFYDSLFEVHITLGSRSEVSAFISLGFSTMVDFCLAFQFGDRFLLYYTTHLLLSIFNLYSPDELAAEDG